MKTGPLKTIGITVTAAVLCAAPAAAQFDLPFKGNPTPGTEQPKPPDLVDRIRLTGCVKQVVPDITPADANTPSDGHFLLVAAKPRQERSRAKTKAPPPGDTFRLLGIDSAIAPLAGSRVEVSGDIVPPNGGTTGNLPTPILRVLVMQRLTAACS